MDDWPGENHRPVHYPMRPGRNRNRLTSEHNMRDTGQAFFDANGNIFLQPAGPRPRATSDAGRRPAQVVINNDNAVHWDDDETFGRRPRSGQFRPDDFPSRERSRSRVRMRTPSPFYGEREWEFDRLKRLEDFEKKEENEKRDRMRRLEQLDRREEDRLAEERIKMKVAQDALEAEKRKKDEQDMKAQAVADWKLKEADDKFKKEEEEKKIEKEVAEGMRKKLWQAGYSDAAIDKIMRKGEKKEKKDELVVISESSSTILTLPRPTYIKVHSKYLETDTLDVYGLPWERDDHDANYILIKQWIPEPQQDVLFEHTRKLRESKRITFTTSDGKRDRDQLLLVRKREPKGKSPVRRSWF